jgi:acyl-CoA thioesterase-1
MAYAPNIQLFLRRACRLPVIFVALLWVASAAIADDREIVILGDSLTQGYGLPPGDGLVPQLQARLDQRGAGMRLVNAGVSGDTTAGGLSRLEWSLSAQTRALVVILGGNDMLRGIDPAVARDNLDQILRRARGRQLPVLLVAMRAPGNFGTAYKSAFDAIYPELAKAHSTMLADHFFLPLLHGPGGGTETASGQSQLAREWMQADGIHPAAAGVEKVADWLAPQIAALLPPTGQATP